jgi:hypothetical protein
MHVKRNKTIASLRYLVEIVRNYVLNFFTGQHTHINTCNIQSHILGAICMSKTSISLETAVIFANILFVYEECKILFVQLTVHFSSTSIFQCRDGPTGRAWLAVAHPKI